MRKAHDVRYASGDGTGVLASFCDRVGSEAVIDFQVDHRFLLVSQVKLTKR